ncbi:hypothetical protein KPH14_007152 [Odynerus spinipes]|uniref:DUF4219 domain-containing protein n=1 Tax=Odynerus spinipes TaxID=1348599 RepID=A0AAD9VK49_9HYME|nr:hypothetical protein KPH14_007152 [Odynerus spinipes]
MGPDAQFLYTLKHVRHIKSWKIDRLNGENYRTWKFAAKMYLIQKDLWPYVTGDAKIKADASLEEKQAHNNKVDKALATIALAIEADQQIHIVDCKTAEEAWKNLKQVYEPKSRQRIMQLKREMIRIRLKEEMKDEDLAYAMLSGLPDSYDSLTMSLANLEDQKFTSTEIKKSLLMEYERRMSKD